MDKYSFFAANFLSGEEYVNPKKNRTCVGCGVSLAVRLVGKVVESYADSVSFERPGKDEIFKGKTDLAFLRVKKGSAELVMCLDDEPKGSIDGVVKKGMPSVAVKSGIAFVATACPSYPFDLIEKVKKALKTEGKSYIHVLCPCPSAWDFNTQDTVKVGFKAVESLAFPLYEVEHGQYRLTNMVLKPRNLNEYLKAQKRFASIKDEEIEAASALLANQYNNLFGAA